MVLPQTAAKLVKVQKSKRRVWFLKLQAFAEQPEVLKQVHRGNSDQAASAIGDANSNEILQLSTDKVIGKGKLPDDRKLTVSSRD